MAVVTPRTWVVGEVVTAAYMNAEIRDQFTPLVGLFACTQVVNSSFSLGSHASNYTALSYSAISSSNNTSMWNISNPTRLVAPRAGTYIVHGGISWPSGLSTNDARAEWRLNGSGSATATARVTTQVESSGNCQAVASGVLIFTAASQYAEVHANQNSGGSLSLNVTMGMTCVSQATS
ncbi:hypothetical protein AVW11_04080 [Streptomyces amritsarensis]|uniref:Uncharacterized protein n=1 Tax=Streptomyces amritsarensis TaxID=681158 RepID=A0ABX3G9P4_9ACTN|nr:hypothetical protein [Streptomyces amritsarensis]OLZ72578.1 hypothetical protein AVW11_04080 [Streptomyces amritsarensis]